MQQRRQFEIRSLVNFMVKIFIAWITFQLMIYGHFSVESINEVNTMSYECHDIQSQSLILGYTLPLTFALPEPKKVTDYCEKLAEIERHE